MGLPMAGFEEARQRPTHSHSRQADHLGHRDRLRGRFRDTPLKNRIVRYLVGGLRDAEHRAVIEEAAAEFALVKGETDRLATRYERRGSAFLRGMPWSLSIQLAHALQWT